MKKHIPNSMAHPEGNWTLKDMTSSTIESLIVSLEKLEPGYGNYLRIDFNQITEVDGFGQQFLYIWFQCLKFRGIEPELFNLPAGLRKTFKKLGFRVCKGIKPPDMARKDFQPALLRECFCVSSISQ
jgi:anti-anti-sigma regulatory factor